jgi:hypothetical protein
MPHRRLLLALPFGLAACTAPTPLPAGDPSVSLPRGAVDGAGDPVRSAINRTAFGFSRGAPFAGEPRQAAEAVAELEFLANVLASTVRVSGVDVSSDPLVAVRFAEARPEWRAAAGIIETAPPQPVINALFAFARSETPLPASLFAADAATRLANLPRMPRTAAATSAASQLLIRLDNERGGATRTGRSR